LQINVGIWPGRRDGYLEYLVAHSWRLPWPIDDDLEGAAVGGRYWLAVDVCIGDASGRASGDADDRVDDLVLVYVGKVREGCERVDLVRIGVVVERLQRFDLARVGSVDVLEKSVSVPLLPITELGVAEDRELDRFGLFLSRLPAEPTNGKLPPSVVERAAEVVDCVANEQPPTVLEFRQPSDSIHDRRRVLLESSIERDSPVVAIRGFKNLRSKRVSVVLRPFELRPGTVERLIGHEPEPTALAPPDQGAFLTQRASQRRMEWFSRSWTPSAMLTRVFANLSWTYLHYARRSCASASLKGVTAEPRPTPLQRALSKATECLPERIPVPESLLRSGKFIPRLSYVPPERLSRASPTMMDNLRARSDWNFFIDASLYDPNRVDEPLWAELLDGRRLMLITRVLSEIADAKLCPEHPLIHALNEDKSGLAQYIEPRRGTWLRDAMIYYVTLLAQRGLALQMLEDTFVAARGRSPDEKEHEELFRLMQRGISVDGMHIYSKTARHLGDPKGTDETLVFLAVMHALLSGQPTAIIAADHDVEIQFHKLINMLASHYRAMHIARIFHGHPSGFKVREVSTQELAESGKFVPELALAIRPRRPMEAFWWAPPDPRYVQIACMTIQADYAAESHFLGETQMLDILRMKSETGGLCTNLFGSHNSYSWRVLDGLKPPEVLLAKDIARGIGSTHLAISHSDMVQTLFGAHVFEGFESSLPDV
jgi:hypothetical protein